jgi:GNAT superfamily N-acetyltransferase
MGPCAVQEARLTQKPPAARRRELQLVSARAQPEVKFQVEPFYVIARELPPLFKQHWRELGRDRDEVILDPNWDQFMADSIAGRLQVLTARAGTELVGYIFYFVGPHLHYKSTLHAHVDMYWLDPQYRHGWTGLRMFRAYDDELKRLGVVRSYLAENLSFKGKHGRRMRVILKRFGYRPCDVMYRKIV